MRTAIVLAMGLIAPGASAADDYAPKAILRIAPKYPKAAYTKRIEGCVRISLIVDERGRTRDFKVEESKPPKMFNEAALHALRRWRYEPHVPTVRTEETMTFLLEPPGPVQTMSQISCDKDSELRGLVVLP